MKKTLFIFILSLFASVEIIFASNTSVDGIYYNFDNTNLTATVTYRGSSFTDYSKEYSGDVTIPQTVTYSGKTYSVTSIGDYAFYKCSSLTSVTIPNSVTSIGSSAFYECSSLTSVTIPNSVTTIGDDAFSNCYSLTSITIPNSVTTIGDHAFYECYGLTSVTLGNSVTTIGDHAFYECSGLTSVVWNAENYADVSYSTSSPFCDIRSQITSFTFGDSVKNIPAFLCYRMSNLTSVTIPNSVTSIGNYAFENCSSLTSVTIPNSVTSIGNAAFYECSSLTSITIPENITHIGARALYLNSSGKKVRLVWNVRNYTDEWYEMRKFGSGDYQSNHPFFLLDYLHNIDRMSFSSIVLGEEVKSLPQNFIQGITVDSLVYSADMIESNKSFNGAIHYIYSKAVNPLPLNGFSGTAVCYIPCGTTATYLNVWGNICNQFIEHPKYEIAVSSSNASYGVAKLVSQPDCESAILTAIPNEGCKFVKWSDGNTQATRYLELTGDVTLTAEFVKEGYTIHVNQDCSSTLE